ncbi:MAG: hypothetical protein FWG02_05855, partial [Holophagaceae bacterium]|nr:hypothetical protein [Holophagaceae bacterium]
AVDEILQTEFGLQQGLADTSKVDIEIEGQGKGKTKAKVHKVQILDPALGTGTFLAETIRQIYDKFKNQQGQWQGYVEQHLIPRLNGFEIMMAPYAMAHLKISWVLAETGYVPPGSQRIRAYLTNSLEEHHPDTGTLFAQFLADEAKEANAVKRDTPVMVVMGNPPYSGISSNTGDWITKLLGDYKKEPASNSPLEERKHWLNDDYVKFIRLGQYFVDKNQSGILAYIANHGFIDNPTFRGMRWSLLQSFDKIYIIDLHGNAKKKEKAPDGTKDENVFDIQQGVSINIFVKTGKKKKGVLAEVYHTDIFGLRQSKYGYLLKSSLKSLHFAEVKPATPYFFLVPKDDSNRDKYEQGFRVDELMAVNTTGIVTARDTLVVDIDRTELLDRIAEFTNLGKQDDEIRERFGLKDSRGWKLPLARRLVAPLDHDKQIVLVDYRPFDCRHIYYHPKMVDWGREKIMRHFLAGPNVGLVIPKINKEDNCFFITKNIIGHKTCSAYDSNSAFPLYLYPVLNGQSNTTPTPNLDTDIVNRIIEGLGIKFNAEAGAFQKGNKSHFTPIDLLDYIYAVLHSPNYREKYKEFLKIDFPRVPYPTDAIEFRRLAKLGEELRLLHLMEHPALNKLITKYPINGSNVVEKLRWEPNKDGSVGKVWINDTQYFDKVPLIAWEFYIGGYQPAQKWLKDRKGKTLTFEDINHYQRIITALEKTDEIMKHIDV